ncbi:hypothetical protein CYLTODRAFT_422247 [Cylindrobasidium torrendii FP15055 ss-10]|uniref:FHA domain-containing protein n=1 Tax=Cylindrobasidium torrendii FP15055 ss-10 TaxID=1314674 RepID=A0A0D7BBA5_9AGAR|nr:hypothetical protein CYLTODRAFT_422247 [Cylindrobasidium torrendii FP15055 ss-10]
MSFAWTLQPGPVITLTPVDGSYPFAKRYISLLRRVTLGEGFACPDRKANVNNGWFDSRHVGEGCNSLALSDKHAELWLENGMVYVRDLGSETGTYVNGVKIGEPVPLQTGDIVSLGTKLVRNAKMPAAIVEEQLLNISAKVSIVGIPH